MKSFSWFKNTMQELGHQQNRSLNPLNTELNPICHLLALLGAHHILHSSRIRVNQHERHFIPGVSLTYKPAMEHFIKFTIDPTSM